MKILNFRNGLRFLGAAALAAAPILKAADTRLPRDFGGATPLEWSVRMARSEIGRLGDRLE
jgi:hypothetical protein